MYREVFEEVVRVDDPNGPTKYLIGRVEEFEADHDRLYVFTIASQSAGDTRFDEATIHESMARCYGTDSHYASHLRGFLQRFDREVAAHRNRVHPAKEIVFAPEGE